MLPQLAQDKANHLIYGAGIALICSHAIHGYDRRVIALAAAAAAGLIKEAMDAFTNYRATGSWRTGPHEVSAYDALATAAGGVLVALSI